MPTVRPKPDEDRWPRPSVAVDVVALTVESRKLQVLVHRRQQTPHEGDLALPGVFLLDQKESPEEAVGRALRDKTNLQSHGSLQLISVENHPERNDPRGWVITIVYLTVVPWWELVEPTAEGSGVRLLDVIDSAQGADRAGVELRTLAGDEAQLAFDHQLLIAKGVQWLRSELFRTDLGLRLVRDQFTLRELQDVYEAILGCELYRTSFRRRLAEGQGRVIEPTGRVRDTDPRKPEVFRQIPK